MSFVNLLGKVTVSIEELKDTQVHFSNQFCNFVVVENRGHSKEWLPGLTGGSSKNLPSV